MSYGLDDAIAVVRDLVTRRLWSECQVEWDGNGKAIDSVLDRLAHVPSR